MAMVTKVLSFSLLHALIISSLRKAQTSRAATISVMRVGLKVSSHAIKCNMKTSLAGWELLVSKSWSRQLLGGGINDLCVERAEEDGRSPWLEASVRPLGEAPWGAYRWAGWVFRPLVGGLDSDFW